MGCLGQVTIVTIVTLRMEALCCGMPGAGYHSYHCYSQDGGVVLWDAWGRLP